MPPELAKLSDLIVTFWLTSAAGKYARRRVCKVIEKREESSVWVWCWGSNPPPIVF